MAAYICVACGTQFQPTPEPPRRCAICEEHRQPVRRDGQAWTTLAELRSEHKNELRELEPIACGALKAAPGGRFWTMLLIFLRPRNEAQP